MKYAYSNHKLIRASDVPNGIEAIDVWLSKPVIAKTNKRPHWSYLKGVVLPNGYENSNNWNSAWKAPISDKFCDVICENHLADILSTKYIFTFQKNYIDIQEVIERKEYYKNKYGVSPVWVINIENVWKNISTKKSNNEFGKDKFKIIWKDSWKWVYDIANNCQYTFLDFNPTNSKLIQIWIIKGVLYGKWIYRLDIYKKFLQETIKPNYEIKYALRDFFMDLRE